MLLTQPPLAEVGIHMDIETTSDASSSIIRVVGKRAGVTMGNWVEAIQEVASRKSCKKVEKSVINGLLLRVRRLQDNEVLDCF